MADSSTFTYPPAPTHGPLQEVFPDVFLVRGTYRQNAMVEFNRNMVIIRDGDKLSILNSVRLDADTEAQLDELGTVSHVLRLGNFHGVDDPYYLHKYSARFWAPAGTTKGPQPDVTIEEGGELPFSAANAFVFQGTRFPECAILLEREGGILLTCDAMQNWTDKLYCSLLAKLMLPLLGFKSRMLIGPMWLKGVTPKGGTIKPEFERLAALQFQHLISAHGAVCKNTAKQGVGEAIAAAYK